MGRRAKSPKGKADAKRPLARKSPKNAGSEVRDLEKRLADALEREVGAVEREAEAREQQAATAEVLRVISGSPMDVQPTFEAIAVAATRLCAAQDSGVVRFDGALMHLMANDGFTAEERDVLRAEFPRPADRGVVTGRAILTRAVAHVPDIQQDPDYNADAILRGRFSRAVLSVPMLQGGHTIGAITVTRRETVPFSEAHIALLQTFADQAVIAIENVRLFKELESRNRDLTATADILQAISQSPTDARPVFEAIADSALRLFRAWTATVFRLEGDFLHPLAARGGLAGSGETVQYRQPQKVTRDFVSGRCIVDRSVVHIADLETDPDAPARTREVAPARGFRAALAVPLLRDSQPIGTIAVSRVEPGRFSNAEITLLKTFADQAVIAIENVRLFNETKEALERQTATSEILRVISSSPTDAQPVFDAIVQSARRLLCGHGSGLTRVVGNMLHLQAFITGTQGGDDAARAVFPIALSSNKSVHSRAVRTRAPAIVTDVETDPMFERDMREMARTRGYRSVMAVPLLREGEPIGAISVTRPEAGSFTDKQVALLKTFADQAVIAIENVRLFTQLQSSNRDLTTALDKQTATSDILRVISRSQTDVKPVFDTILGSALRLLGGYSGGLTRLVGDQIVLVAITSTDPAGDSARWALYPQPLHSESAHAQAIRSRAPVNVADAQEDPGSPEAFRAAARARGFRSVIAVPLLRHDEPVGAMTVTRREAGGFTGDEIALLQTFADQAVIAIENARLLTALQTSNRELTSALDTQTATSDILRVISRSQTDVQPVFDAILGSAVRLLGGYSGGLTRIEGDQIVLAAITSTDPAGDSFQRASYPVPLNSERSLHAEAVRRRAPVNLADAQEDPLSPVRDTARARGFRSLVAVPLLQHDEPVGAMTVTRREAGGFTGDEIALLQTFADQAVIAIENARLLTELQTSNRELTSALDTQTATGDILRVISRSQTDVQPVFDGIVVSAARLLRGHTSALTRVVGDEIELVALTSADAAGDAALRATFPRSLHSEGTYPQVIRERAPHNYVDVSIDPRVHEAARASARVRGFGSAVVVPILRHDEAIGTISVTRRETGGFTDDEIALLRTFADQAVIAIENARLLTELQTRTADLTRSVGELTALGEMGRALSSTLDLETVLQTIVLRANELAGTAGCTIWEYDEGREEFRLRASDYADEADAAALQTSGPVRTIRRGFGVTGQVLERRRPVQIHDIAVQGAEENPIRRRLIDAGHHALLAVPLLREDDVIGVLVVTRKTPGEFQPETVQLLSTFATQSALAIQNARLFREIEIKSRELEVASQHKSEFLASMSHELRTPLNAIIGFSDVLLQGMFGDMTDKQTEYLKDILASGQHLLSLINDILDLSKIEAGRMDLDLADFHLPSAIDDALLLMRERASRRGLALERHVDERLGEIRADQRKVKQVLLNLLSNAVKFTPEGGRIDVRAAVVDGSVEISVTDTGIGIAPEDQEVVFEEFRQVGKSDKKAEGTGLGLALCRKFVELHGGRIWVKSQVGQGSTFAFTIPLRQEASAGGGTSTLIS